jgi:predicted esterase
MIMGVHQKGSVLELGPEFQDAERVLILIHGRGATAESMLSVAEALQVPGTRVLLPQAAGNRWYPETAFGPLEVNEPDLSSALQVIDDLIAAAREVGVERSRIVLGGFSQGACLAAEYVVRNPAQYGGLLVFSGALIGPPEEPREPEGYLHQTPVFIGGSDVDPWIAQELLTETARILHRMGGEVDFQIYPGMGHTINHDELSRGIALMQRIGN